jgi:quinol monooxygenase YgiN
MTIHQTAYFAVRDGAQETCEKAIREFIEYVREHEPDTLIYASLQEKEDHNHFLHYFIFRDEHAHDLHTSPEAVNHFTSLLHPNLVASVEFTEYHVFASTK